MLSAIGSLIQISWCKIVILLNPLCEQNICFPFFFSFLLLETFKAQGQ